MSTNIPPSTQEEFEHQLGFALSEQLAAMEASQGIDWCDSREVDLLVEAVKPVIEGRQHELTEALLTELEKQCCPTFWLAILNATAQKFINQK